MDRRRISPMKRKNRKLVDLPKGAKPKKDKRRRKKSIPPTRKPKYIKRTTPAEQQPQPAVLPEVVPEVIPDTIPEPDTDSQVLARALETPVELKIPEVLHNCIHLIRDVQRHYLRFIREYYLKLYQSEISDFQRAIFELAVIAAKIDKAQAKDVISLHLDLYNNIQFSSSHQEEDTMTNTTTAKETNTIDTVVDSRVNQLINSHHKQRNFNRNIAMLSSMGAAVAVGAAEMALKGEVDQKSVATVAGTTLLSAGVTHLVMDNFDDGNMSKTNSSLIGGGIGLGIAGSTAALTRFFSGEQPAE